MDYELIKNEFINLKKEELSYIDSIAKISSSKKLSEYEKIEIYRKLNSYKVKLNEILNKLRNKIIAGGHLERKKFKCEYIEFDLNNNFLSSLNFNNDVYKKRRLVDLGIDSETYKFKLSLYNLIYRYREYSGVDSDEIQNNQKLIEKPIYIFSGYDDYSDDCYGPCFGDPDNYLYAVYVHICSEYAAREEIHKKKMDDFEKDKIIIRSKRYVSCDDIREIFKEELINVNNMSLNDCVIQTQNRVEELSYIRSPEYKEKVLLDRINELYKKVKGDFIKKELLYSGNFLGVLRETYKLPNQNIVSKEKIIKNDGKNSVIIIAINQDKEYIITFQNRIKDKIIAEFPSGYIENDESPIEAAKRELKEETGYITDDLFIVDEVYTSPGIDNSVTYIVIANNCIESDEKNINSTELINYGLFSEMELKYIVSSNIMNGAMNKLAYYNLINNVDDSNYTYVSNKKVYKRLKKKKDIKTCL